MIMSWITVVDNRVVLHTLRNACVIFGLEFLLSLRRIFKIIYDCLIYLPLIGKIKVFNRT